MAYVGWSSVANQVNTTTGAALDVNGQVTSSLYYGAGVGGEGATNLILAPSLNLNFALYGETTLDPRINFSRTSNATITNSAGVISYAPHNLLTYSEQFDNAAWTKTGSTITANNIVAPNETTTADKLVETAVTSGHNVQVSTTLAATTYTVSVYAKKAENNYLWIRVDALTFNKWVYFNLDLGTTYTTDTGITYSISPSSNGFYRCSVTWAVTTAGTGTVYYGTTDTEGVVSYLGDGTSGIYIWGAQLEIGSTATTYNSTTVKNLLGYSELFDNAAWTKSNSFVQTNLLTYSEAFDNAAWAKTTITATANSILAPNEYQTADTLAATGSNSRALQTFTASAVAYTFSVWLKRKTGTGNIDITVDGTTYVTKTITNDWIRVETTLTPAAGSKTAGIRIATSGDEVYAWGAQLVQGATAGDYRRTDAAALPIYYANHNGVVCAEKLVENTATSEHRIQVTPTLGTAPITASIYFKASERSWAFIRLDDSISVKYAYFNLSTGIVGTVTAGLTASIVNAGNGWYRCSATFNAPSAGSGGILFAPTTGNGTSSYTGNGTSGIYIFGAQVSDSASLDPYVLNVATAPSAAAYYGARFYYDPVTLAPKGLLIEEQRANLLLNSSLAGTNLATQSVTVTAVAHTLSFYGTGTVTLTGTANTSLVGTGAYPTRSTLTFTPTAGVVLFTVTGTVQYAQLEIGSFATSFIPTAASQVTRTADVASIQGSNFYSWYNQNEGSWYSEVSNNAQGIDRRQITLRQDTAVYYGQRITTANFSAFTYRLPASYDTNDVAVSIGIIKQGVAYNSSSIATTTNNNTVKTNSIPNTIIGAILYLGFDGVGFAFLNGTIKQISYYPTRLNNDTLKGLTA